MHAKSVLTVEVFLDASVRKSYKSFTFMSRDWFCFMCITEEGFDTSGWIMVGAVVLPEFIFSIGWQVETCFSFDDLVHVIQPFLRGSVGRSIQWDLTSWRRCLLSIFLVVRRSLKTTEKRLGWCACIFGGESRDEDVMMRMVLVGLDGTFLDGKRSRFRGTRKAVSWYYVG